MAASHETWLLRLGAVVFSGKRRTPPSAPKRILVIKIAGIGDVLMATPLIRAVRRTYPGAALHVLTGRWAQEVLAGNPSIDRIIAVDDRIIWERRWRAIFPLVRSIRRERYDLGFVLDRHVLAPLFAFACGIRFRVGFNRRGEGFANNRNVPFGPVRHEILYNLDLLQSIAGERSFSTTMEIFPQQTDRKRAESFIREYGLARTKLIGLMVGGAQNPGQNAFLKRWPVRYYHTLLKTLLRETRCGFILFGSGDDRALNEGIVQLDSVRIHSVDSWTLREAAALMAHCTVFVTHDTGPMHLAAAVGIPVISLSGPVHPGRTAPLGGMHTNLWRSDIPDAGCYDDAGHFPVGNAELACLRAITPHDVQKALHRYGIGLPAHRSA